MIVIYVIALIAGFIALIKGAGLFVDGSSSLASHCRIPSLVIGMTVVALGTSAPELAVSTTAALQGSNEIAMSNVVGSNLVNILAVLGICAVISPIHVNKQVLKRDFPFGIIITGAVLLVITASLIGESHITSYPMEQNIGMVTRIMGIALVAIFVGYVCYLIISARNRQEDDTLEQEDDTPEASRSILKCVLLILVGMALIIAGGQAVVVGAKEIARAFGMTETLIGLTVVAVGTSLPEMVTSIVAAKKGEAELAIGNLIGSNIFNLMFILGISALIDPVEVNLASALDMTILLGASLLTLIFSYSGRRIGRGEGMAMLGIYCATVAFAIIR